MNEIKQSTGASDPSGIRLLTKEKVLETMKVFLKIQVASTEALINKDID